MNLIMAVVMIMDVHMVPYSVVRGAIWGLRQDLLQPGVKGDVRRQVTPGRYPLGVPEAFVLWGCACWRGRL